MSFGGSSFAAALLGSLSAFVNSALTGYHAAPSTWFNDTAGVNIASGSGGNTYVQHENYPWIDVTPAGASLSIEAINLSSGTVAIWDTVGDGTLLQVIDFSGQTVAVKATLVATVTPGTRIRLESHGCEITGLGAGGQTYTVTLAAAPSVSLTMYGHSIPEGYSATTGATLHQGYAGLLRHALAPFGWKIQNHCKFGRGLSDALETGSAPTQTAVIAQLGNDCNGTVRKILLIDLLVNDWSRAQVTPAQFATLLGGFVDELHSTFPAIEVWLSTAIFSSNGGTIQIPAGTGSFYSLADMRVAMAGVASGRAFITKVIDGLNDLPYTHANLVDLYHPNAAGHVEIFNRYMGICGFTRAAASGQIKGPTSADTATVTNPATTFESVVGTGNVKAELRQDAAVLLDTTPRAQGTAAPAVTWSGTLTRTDVLFIQIDGAGTGAAATFKWSVDGGASFVATGVSCAATVALGATGVTAAFPNSAYLTDNTYSATCKTYTDAVNGIAFTAPTSVQCPKLIYQGLNGHRTLRFGGVGFGTTTLVSTLVVGGPPYFVWMLIQHISWTSGKKVCGGSNASTQIFQSVGTPKLRQFAGTSAGSANLTLSTWKRVQAQFSNSAAVDFIQCGSNTSGVGTSAGNTGATAFAIGDGTSCAEFDLAVFGIAGGTYGATALDAVSTAIGGAAMIT